VEYDAEIFPAHYTWKVAEKGFMMASMMNKLVILLKLFLKNKINFFAKNHCQIQVHTILVCALYSIKYSNLFKLTLLAIRLGRRLLQGSNVPAYYVKGITIQLRKIL
jgi:hypothetical protein